MRISGCFGKILNIFSKLWYLSKKKNCDNKTVFKIVTVFTRQRIYIYLLALSQNCGKKSYGFKNWVKFFFFLFFFFFFYLPTYQPSSCAQKPIGSREQCAQKQIKPLRGPAAKVYLKNAVKSSPKYHLHRVIFVLFSEPKKSIYIVWILINF